MKTKIGHYYVFFDINEFWKKVNYWKSKGRVWIQENHKDYNPEVDISDLPVVLNVDSKYILHGIINFNRHRYFSDPLFLKIYNQS